MGSQIKSGQKRRTSIVIKPSYDDTPNIVKIVDVPLHLINGGEYPKSP